MYVHNLVGVLDIVVPVVLTTYLIHYYNNNELHEICIFGAL